MELSATQRRLLLVANALFAVAHVVAPGVLVAVVKRLYAAVLAVDFQPTEATETRVKLLGVLSLLALPLQHRLLKRFE